MIYYSIAYALVIIAAVIICLYYMHILDKKFENELMTYYLNDMELVYQGIKKEVDATRKFRHDFNKHLATLEYLMQQDNADYHETYETLKLSYNAMKPAYLSHEVINAVIALKVEECIRKDVRMSLDVKDGQYDRYPDIDLVSLIFNLLDNAIEAASHTDKQSVSFAMSCDDALTIHMTNDYKKSFQKTNRDASRHGIGHLIIKDIIKKYDGTYQLRMTGNRYEQTIMMEIPS